MAIRKVRAQKKTPTATIPASPAWQLQEAKARFSEVFRRARSEGPQKVTKQGTEAVIVLPVEEFDRLIRRSLKPKTLVEFFADSPLAEAALDLERIRDYGRDIERRWSTT